MYNFNITANPATKGTGRFVIVYAPSATTGLASTKGVAGFYVYPNPSNGQGLNLALDNIGTDLGTIIVSDVLGRVVYTHTVDATLSRQTLDTKLAKGVYQVTLRTSKASFVNRLVVE